jgi:hypothetical protein
VSAVERRASVKPVAGAAGVSALSSLADDEAADGVVADDADPTDIASEAGAVSVGFAPALGAPGFGPGGDAFLVASTGGSDVAGVEVISGVDATDVFEMFDDNSPCGSADIGAEIIRAGLVEVLAAASLVEGRSGVSPADGSYSALAAFPLAGVPMLTALFSPRCTSKKIVTDATATTAAKPRRSLRQCRVGPPWLPGDKDPATGAKFPGDSGFAISPGAPRISDAIALKALCCEGEVGALGVIIRA